MEECGREGEEGVRCGAWASEVRAGRCTTPRKREERERERERAWGGQVYDAKGIEAIGSLPSKQELYAQVVTSPRHVPAVRVVVACVPS